MTLALRRNRQVGELLHRYRTGFQASDNSVHYIFRPLAATYRCKAPPWRTTTHIRTRSSNPSPDLWRQLCPLLVGNRTTGRSEGGLDRIGDVHHWLTVRPGTSNKHVRQSHNRPETVGARQFGVWNPLPRCQPREQLVCLLPTDFAHDARQHGRLRAAQTRPPRRQILDELRLAFGGGELSNDFIGRGILSRGRLSRGRLSRGRLSRGRLSRGRPKEISRVKSHQC